MTAKSHICLLSLGHVATDWAQSALPALLPWLIAHHGLSYQAAAMLVFANMLMASLLQPLFGYYADRFSRPWFVHAGPATCGLSIAAVGFATSYGAIFLASMLGGLGVALYHPEASVLINRLAGKRKAQWMSFFGVGGNAGFALGPVIVGLCAYCLDDVRLLALFGAANLIVAAMLRRATPGMLRLAAANETASPSATAQPRAENDWHSFAVLSLAMAARSLEFTLTNTFLPLYLIGVLGATAQWSANALSALFGLGVPITMLGGYVADRFGCVRTLRGAFLLMLPAMLALSQARDLGVAMALVAPISLALYLPFSATVVLGQTYLARNAGFASGVTMGLTTSLGGLLAPAVGWLADHYGLSTAMQLPWLIALPGLASAFLLTAKRARDRS